MASEGLEADWKQAQELAAGGRRGQVREGQGVVGVEVGEQLPAGSVVAQGEERTRLRSVARRLIVLLGGDLAEGPAGLPRVVGCGVADG